MNQFIFKGTDGADLAVRPFHSSYEGPSLQLAATDGHCGVSYLSRQSVIHLVATLSAWLHETESTAALGELFEHIEQYANEIGADLETGSHEWNNAVSAEFAKQHKYQRIWAEKLARLVEAVKHERKT